MGGVEANCRIVLDFGDVTRDGAAQPRLGAPEPLRDHRDRRVDRVGRERGGPLRSRRWRRGPTGDVALHDAHRPRWLGADGTAADFDDAFADQLRRAGNRPEGGGLPVRLGGRTPCQSLGLIDQCYVERRQMAMPWMSAGRGGSR